jgi:antitoxin VapB
MINLSPETIALAQRLAAAHGVSTEDAIKQAIEQSAREAGVMAPEPRRELSAAAIAARKARIDRIVDEIAAMPVLDPRSPREIMDDLNAL